MTLKMDIEFSDELDEISEVTTFFDGNTKRADATNPSMFYLRNSDAFPLGKSSSNDLVSDIFIEYNYNKVLTSIFNDSHADARDLELFAGDTTIKFNPDILDISFSLVELE